MCHYRTLCFRCGHNTTETTQECAQRKASAEGDPCTPNAANTTTVRVLASCLTRLCQLRYVQGLGGWTCCRCRQLGNNDFVCEGQQEYANGETGFCCHGYCSLCLPWSDIEKFVRSTVEKASASS